MASSFDALLKKFNANGPASAELMEGVEKEFGCALPADYKAFMRTYDGGEGFIGDRYLILWRTRELIDFNRDYQAATYAPGLLLFGSDGGGEAFAFDTRQSEEMRIRLVPFTGMSLKNALPVAGTFDSFLTRLAKSNGSDPRQPPGEWDEIWMRCWIIACLMFLGAELLLRELDKHSLMRGIPHLMAAGCGVVLFFSSLFVIFAGIERWHSMVCSSVPWRYCQCSCPCS